jgi:hypothetical protein
VQGVTRAMEAQVLRKWAALVSMKQADQRTAGLSHLIGAKALVSSSRAVANCLFALEGRRLSLGRSGPLPRPARHVLRDSCAQSGRGASIDSQLHGYLCDRSIEWLGRLDHAIVQIVRSNSGRIFLPSPLSSRKSTSIPGVKRWWGQFTRVFADAFCGRCFDYMNKCLADIKNCVMNLESMRVPGRADTQMMPVIASWSLRNSGSVRRCWAHDG